VIHLRRLSQPWLRIHACLLGILLFWSLSLSAAPQAASIQEVLDLDEAALLLRVDREAVRALAEAHGIPGRRVGEVWRFSRAALLEWLKGEPLSETQTPISKTAGASSRIEGIEAELPALSGRGTTAGPPQDRDPGVQASSSPAGQQPPTVGERRSTPTAEEMALRDQRVLLPGGSITADFEMAYGHAEQTLFPVIRSESRTAALTGTLRYAPRDNLQLTLRMPFLWRRSEVFSDASVTGSSTRRGSREHFAGDGAISLLGVAWRESTGRPTLIWSLDGVVPAGAGDRAVGAGFVLSKSYDPTVLFAGLNYLHGMSIEPADSRRSLAQHNFALTLGYTYAVNETLALNTVLVGTYRNWRSPDSLSIPPSHERFDLRLGMTWLLAHNLFMEPAAAIRLAGDNPALTLSLNFSRSFRNKIH
jgi:excisionase family DNA binding protein